MADITSYKLDAAFAPLKQFDHCAKPNAFIEVQETAQGAGRMTGPVLKPYRVTTTMGSITVEAYSVAHAIRTALELLGGQYCSCLQEGDW